LLGFRDHSGAMGAEADAEWLRWVSKKFGNVAGKGKEIGLEEFKSALEVKESFFAERFFSLFDSDGSGSLSPEELLGSLRRLLRADPTEKLRFLFQVYDVDGERRKPGCPGGGFFGINLGFGSGSIEAEELRAVLRECLRESSLALPEERLGALSQALLQALDRDGSGSITFPELRQQLEAFPELLENLSISAASWLKPPHPSPSVRCPCCFSRECRGDESSGPCCFSRECRGDESTGPCCFSRECRGDESSGRCCLWLWLAASALLLALGALWHRGRGPALALARGCGQSLNLNCALLAALMLRRSLTRLRSSPLAELFPLELHVRGHELVAYLVLALGTAHTGGHLAHAGLSGRCWRPALAAFLGGGAGWAPQSGLALQALLLAMLLGSSPCVRRGGHFQVFYWSHLSYIPVWFLLLLHGPHFWKWFLIPGSLFVLEKVLGWAWRRAGDLRILEARLLPSKVTHLVIQRPGSFRFQPGDYVYLNVPAIAAHEWHPFSISSAPEQTETLWLHIRALGQWTNKLYEYFQQLEPRGPGPDPPGRSQSWEPQCFLDGPYGTPSRRIFTSEHAVLIGAGIGITPFASILQSIMFRYRRRRLSCPSCGFSWSEARRQEEEMRLRKVDFIWITRDQQHLQWFLGLLAKLEAEQAELEPGGKFLELHLYMTSALGRADVKALGLQLALDLLAAREERDSITGLRTRTQPGRPDWERVFGQVRAQRRGRVRVFFCGSAGLGSVIRRHCRHFGFAFSKENF
ncbi:NOX5 oxidase, partial [Cettia cetti]|nr:NOX5 oxidase [Cettia cetti]